MRQICDSRHKILGHSETQNVIHFSKISTLWDEIVILVTKFLARWERILIFRYFEKNNSEKVLIFRENRKNVYVFA